MDLKKKRILVTGGTGHLGSNLIHYLLKERQVPPEHITVFVPRNGKTRAFKDIKEINFFWGDILEPLLIEEACADQDLAWHVVGNTSFDPAKKRIQWLVNVEGTLNFLNACLKSPKLEKIVYTSTVNVLGAPDPVGSLGDENTSPYKPKTRSIHSFKSKEQVLRFIDQVHSHKKSKAWVKKIGVGYFDSKLAAQEIVQQFHEEHDLPVVSTLPGTFFGPMDHFIGNGIYILRVFQGKIPVFVKTGFPLTHVRDVVRGQILAMEKGKPGEKYIINGKTEDNKYMGEMLDCIADIISNCEPEREIKRGWKRVPYWLAMFGATISEAYARLTKSPCLLSKATVRASKIISFYSHKKAENNLNYRPEHSFEDAVLDHYLYYKENDMLTIKHRTG